jgi:hypothetical protein
MKKEYIHPVTGKPISRQRAWQLKNKEEGKCTNCGCFTFYKNMCNLCIKKTKEKQLHRYKDKNPEIVRRISKQEWDQIDLTKPAKELCKELGVTTQTIYNQRKKRINQYKQISN